MPIMNCKLKCTYYRFFEFLIVIVSSCMNEEHPKRKRGVHLTERTISGYKRVSLWMHWMFGFESKNCLF
jgi:hypothetical protein